MAHSAHKHEELLVLNLSDGPALPSGRTIIGIPRVGQPQNSVLAQVMSSNTDQLSSSEAFVNLGSVMSPCSEQNGVNVAALLLWWR